MCTAWAQTEGELRFSVALSDKLPNKQIGNQQKACTTRRVTKREMETQCVRERGAAQSCCQLPTEEEQILRITWPPKRGAIRVNFVLQAEAADEAEAVAVAGHPVGSGRGAEGGNTHMDMHDR